MPGIDPDHIARPVEQDRSGDLVRRECFAPFLRLDGKLDGKTLTRIAEENDWTVTDVETIWRGIRRKAARWSKDRRES